jgi:hypothetical protein
LPHLHGCTSRRRGPCRSSAAAACGEKSRGTSLSRFLRARVRVDGLCLGLVACSYPARRHLHRDLSSAIRTEPKPPPRLINAPFFCPSLTRSSWNRSDCMPRPVQSRSHGDNPINPTPRSKKPLVGKSRVSTFFSSRADAEKVSHVDADGGGIEEARQIKSRRDEISIHAQLRLSWFLIWRSDLLRSY